MLGVPPLAVRESETTLLEGIVGGGVKFDGLPPPHPTADARTTNKEKQAAEKRFLPEAKNTNPANDGNLTNTANRFVGKGLASVAAFEPADTVSVTSTGRIGLPGCTNEG